MIFKETIRSEGSTTTIHASNLEAEFISRNVIHGVSPWDVPLPFLFYDKYGRPCQGRADAITAGGVLLEVKGNHLNNKTSKQSAQNAENRELQSWSEGHITAKQLRWRLLESQWNHSAYAIQAKQKAARASGTHLVLVFTSRPDASTQTLLDKLQIDHVCELDAGWLSSISCSSGSSFYSR